MPCNKPSQEFLETAFVRLIGAIYVSRAALKLKHFLEDLELELGAFKLSKCLDLGSSTGGFAQVLLGLGAKEVTCIDVGSNQMHESLRDRVILHENTDLRDYENTDYFDLLTADLSFISLGLLLPKIASFNAALYILLFKPSFELAPSIKRNKKGVIQDEKALQKALINFEQSAKAQGFCTVFKALSKIRGKEGNFEYFFAFKREQT